MRVGGKKIALQIPVVWYKKKEEGKNYPLPSLPWPLGHVRLISFLGLVCAALLFFSTC
jgi:hypothetical protein